MGARARLAALLRDVAWRNDKAIVGEELGLPPRSLQACARPCFPRISLFGAYLSAAAITHIWQFFINALPARNHCPAAKCSSCPSLSSYFSLFFSMLGVGRACKE